MRKMMMVVVALLLTCLCAAAWAEDGAARDYLGDSFTWAYAQEVDPQLPKMLPVYAAPSEDAWRGAKGKAAVSLTDPLIVLGQEPDSDWLLIEYDLSATERRIGYVCSEERWSAWSSELSLAGISVTLTEDTALTDDPRASGRAMTMLSGGSQVSALGCVGEEWLYVETTVDGKAARGFVPSSAVALPEIMAMTDVMERLEGVWGFSGGAEIVDMGVIFTAEGSLLMCDSDDMETPPTYLIPDRDREATYAVYPRQPEDRRFWSDYVIALEVDGSRSVYGLSFYPAEEDEPERIHIEWGPSGGFYTRYETEPAIE